MALLITPLLFLGFFSVACRVSADRADSANTKSNEHLITLRDYDFVGEDPRLSAALAQRLAVLQRPLDPQELATPARHRGPALPDVRQGPAYQPRPDYLRSHLKFPQMVNVSLDYADMLNASELIPDVNAWNKPAPAPAGVPSPVGRSATEQSTATPLSSDPAHGPGPEQFPGPGGRRQSYKDPSFRSYNNKILDLMKQSVYGTQRKILELDSVITHYETDPRFRMAYIFNRLDEWLHDLRTVYTAMMRPVRRVKRLIWYYEHSLRINIDITYSVEHLVYLHSEYMKAMELIVPKSKRMQMRAKAKKLKDQETSSEPATPPPPPK